MKDLTEERQHWSTINPGTGQPLTQYFYATDQEITEGLQLLEQEFRRFRRQSVQERLEGIQRLARKLRENRRALALLMAQEMGKPIRQGLGEIDKCAATCDYYAEMGEQFAMSTELFAHYEQTWLVKRPLGVVLAVMPWNFPFWQVIRCAVPAWVTGNVILLKHAPSVQGCARWIQELVQSAFGMSTLLQLPMTLDQTEKCLSDSRIRALSFTGSTQVGRRLAALAGQNLKPSVLELGGSDAYLVLDDADLELAAQKCVASRFINSGQSCIAGKRFLIHQTVYEPFRTRVIEKVRALKVGDPTLETTDVGPMAEERLRILLQRQLSQSVEMGAQVFFGGSTLDPLVNGPGFFFTPTLVENVSPLMPVFNEECFGPLMPLLPISSLAEGIALANLSSFGLGAALFTARPERVWEAAAEELEAGTVVINDSVQSDPRVPFGGVKDSGWGRELGQQGVLEFTNFKTVGVAKAFF
jgi:succinate-semialdehyde dehydrogenase/glutarate-semialdehyde dehydrogenase